MNMGFNIVSYHEGCMYVTIISQFDESYLTTSKRLLGFLVTSATPLNLGNKHIHTPTTFLPDVKARIWRDKCDLNLLNENFHTKFKLLYVECETLFRFKNNSF